MNTNPNINPEPKKVSFVKKMLGNPWIVWTIGAVIVALVVLGLTYFKITNSQIYIDQASITAPQIMLGPTQPDILQNVYVQEGDMVTANETVAQVGNELIKAKVAGEVIAVDDTVGALIEPGQAVVTMIDPTQLRVVGQLDEDKGLSSVHVGQTAVFTVDAYGSQKFAGVVDEISPTSNQSDVVFNISTEREEQQFDIKVRYDISTYPQLKNGMSARVWIFK